MPRGAVPDLVRQCGSGGTLTVGLHIRCGSRKTPVAGPVTPPESWRQRAGVRSSRGSIGLRASLHPHCTILVRRRCSRRRHRALLALHGHNWRRLYLLPIRLHMNRTSRHYYPTLSLSHEPSSSMLLKTRSAYERTTQFWLMRSGATTRIFLPASIAA